MGYKDAVRHRYSIVGQEYLLTTCTQNRNPIFHNFQSARSVVRVMRQLEIQNQAIITCWVIMPDHIHLLLQLKIEKELSGVVALLKVNASKFAGFHIPWQKGFHERALRNYEDRRTVARYIIMNPVRAGLVRSIRQYPHWDSSFL
ncbi:REP-associated tyrosine transposase [Marinobacter caseinilyticus]|uniref:REP-associated tyrosine transposase n=1 Tax=Marinobacter caseinilyticus TaxID=2692195 RepID=UPI001408E0E9|nr:transposase [Marinobacter caseinilyticus]